MRLAAGVDEVTVVPVRTGRWRAGTSVRIPKGTVHAVDTGGVALCGRAVRVVLHELGWEATRPDERCIDCGEATLSA